MINVSEKLSDFSSIHYVGIIFGALLHNLDPDSSQRMCDHIVASGLVCTWSSLMDNDLGQRVEIDEFLMSVYLEFYVAICAFGDDGDAKTASRIFMQMNGINISYGILQSCSLQTTSFSACTLLYYCNTHNRSMLSDKFTAELLQSIMSTAERYKSDLNLMSKVTSTIFDILVRRTDLLPVVRMAVSPTTLFSWAGKFHCLHVDVYNVHNSVIATLILLQSGFNWGHEEVMNFLVRSIETHTKYARDVFYLALALSFEFYLNKCVTPPVGFMCVHPNVLSVLCVHALCFVHPNILTGSPQSKNHAQEYAVWCCLKLLQTVEVSETTPPTNFSNILRCISVVSKMKTTVAKITFKNSSFGAQNLYGIGLINVLLSRVKLYASLPVTDKEMKIFRDTFMIISNLLVASRPICNDVRHDLMSLLWTEDMEPKIAMYCGEDRNQYTLLPETLLVTLLVNSDNTTQRRLIGNSCCIKALLQHMDTTVQSEQDVKLYLHAIAYYAQEPSFLKDVNQSIKHRLVLAMHCRSKESGNRSLKSQKKKQLLQAVIINEDDNARARNAGDLLILQLESEQLQSSHKKRNRRKKSAAVDVKALQVKVVDETSAKADAVVDVRALQIEVEGEAGAKADAVVDVRALQIEVEGEAGAKADAVVDVRALQVKVEGEAGAKVHEKYIDVKALQVEVEDEESKTSAAPGSDVITECVICMNANPTHVFIPCGHQALCESCVKLWTSPTCVMCRTSYTSIVSRNKVELVLSLTEKQMSVFTNISPTDLAVLQTQCMSVEKQRFFIP